MADPRANVQGTVNAQIINTKTLAEAIADQTIHVLLVDRAGNVIVANGAVPVSGVTVEQGSDTTDAEGPLMQAAVNETQRSFNDGEVMPLSMDIRGRLRVTPSRDGSPWERTKKSQWSSGTRWPRRFGQWLKV